MTGGRPRLEIGGYGDIAVVLRPSGGLQAAARYRDSDGQVRKVTAVGASRNAAKSALRAKLASRAAMTGFAGEPGGDSTVGDLAAAWLADVQVRTDLAAGTKDLYRRELQSLVLPALAGFRLREMTTGRVDRFLKEQAARSYARARHAPVVLNLMFNFALRQVAINRNPVTGTSRLSRQKPVPKALTLDQIALVRMALNQWRSGASVSGPRRDGQVRDLIEVMLGTGERIGEALALRKCDVDTGVDPVQVTVAGTPVAVKGRPVFRQEHPKTDASRRTVTVPAWIASVLRRRLALVADEPGEHLLFFTRRGTPLAPYNARRTLRKVLADAGLQDLDVTPHSFRRTGAAAIARAADAETAAAFLGHGSADITRAHSIEADAAPVSTGSSAYLQGYGPEEAAAVSGAERRGPPDQMASDVPMGQAQIAGEHVAATWRRRRGGRHGSMCPTPRSRFETCGSVRPVAGQLSRPLAPAEDGAVGRCRVTCRWW